MSFSEAALSSLGLAKCRTSSARGNGDLIQLSGSRQPSTNRGTVHQRAFPAKYFAPSRSDVAFLLQFADPLVQRGVLALR